MQTIDPELISPVNVAVGVLISTDKEKVLISKRAAYQHQGGLWEFPGGKINVDTKETSHQALVREFKEEIGILPLGACWLMEVPHRYPDKFIVLHVWYFMEFDGRVSSCEGQEICWVKISDLEQYPFPIANSPILARVKEEFCK